jgi:hypothetical protein
MSPRATSPVAEQNSSALSAPRKNYFDARDVLEESNTLSNAELGVQPNPRR